MAEEMIAVTVRLADEEVRRLDEIVADSGCPLEELVRAAVRALWLPDPPAPPSSPEAARERLKAIMVDLRAVGETDESEEEIAAFVREEVNTYRAERRQARSSSAASNV